MVDKKLFTVVEAGEALSVNKQTVYQLIWSGQLAWVNLSTNKRPRIRIEVAEVDRFIARRRHGPKF